MNRFWRASVGLLGGVTLGLMTPSLPSEIFSCVIDALSPVAYANKGKNNSNTQLQKRNPADLITVPKAKPNINSQNILFPSVYANSKYKPPIPTLSSSLSPHEQAVKMEMTLPYGLPSIENVSIRGPFVSSMNFRTRNPNWVAEHLYRRADGGKPTIVSRTGMQFYSDTSIPAVFRSLLADYTNTGFGRGHLAPAANHNDKEDTLFDTFVLSNVVPQNHVMNEGDWLKLEKLIRHMTKHFSNVRVITGPLYLPDRRNGYLAVTTEIIGNSHVHVPSHLFKIIYLSDREVVSYCDKPTCDLTPEILKAGTRFTFPREVYHPHHMMMKQMIRDLPRSSAIHDFAVRSYDFRAKYSMIDVLPQLTGMDEIVALCFIIPNNSESTGHPLTYYMTSLSYLERVSGLCLTPRQDMQSVTMSTWNGM